MRSTTPWADDEKTAAGRAGRYHFVNETSAQLVQSYYDVLEGGAASYDTERLRRILAPDLEFEGPIAGRRVGAEGFIKGAAGFAETMQSLAMIQQVCEEDAAAALYDAQLPGGTVRFAEFFRIADGRIRTLRLLYDAAEYRSKGGR